MPMVRLLVVFTVAFSLAALAGPLAADFRLPTIPLAYASTGVCQTTGSSGACSEFWYPAGPDTNTELASIFVSGSAEYSNLQSANPSIDFTDWPCLPAVCASINNNQNLTVTPAVGEVGYYEIQFMLANNFWGVNMNFGNSLAGVQIRQGIAHMVDKNIFVNQDPSCAGICTAIDNPLPTPIGGGLPGANPCAWDSANVETGSQCIVGGGYLGVTAYHLAAATTCTPAAPFASMLCPGSPDLNAAAAHFVAAGIATGFNASTSVLTGISPSASTGGHVPTFFVRNDDTRRLDLGHAYMAQICYLFTGSYTVPCLYLNVILGSITALPGLPTSTTGVNLNWWMYTGGFVGGTFFDSSLYSIYNSRFVSGIPTIQCTSGSGSSCSPGPCSPASVPSYSAPDYMYLCSPAYDSMSSQMEYSPCLSASGDPVVGATSNFPTPPGNGLCPGTTSLSAISAGVQAEDLFGQGSYTIPVFEIKDQYGAYCTSSPTSPGPRPLAAGTSSCAGYWINVINGVTSGLPNFFTWLNAWNPSSPQSGTIRQAFAEDTGSLSPYIASTPWDSYVVNNIYDSLYRSNPLSPAQSINWMTVATQDEPNSALTYTPPGGACSTPGGPCTVTTYRFTLRNDMFFQDGTKVTSYDVAYSYLSLLATGAFQGAGASSLLAVTILGPNQFDLNLNQNGPFTLAAVTGLTVMPGHDWVANPSAWNRAVITCTAMSSNCYPAQYALSGGAVTCVMAGCGSFPASNMQWDTSKISASFDPLSSGILVGSGPWECGSGASLGRGCSSTGLMNPGIGGTYTLTRFGNGLAPASSISGIYFRSAGNLALWTWSGDTGRITQDFLNFSVVAACFGSAPLPLGTTTGCGRFQQGIGANGGPIAVGLNQVAIVNRFVGVNWVSPFDWSSAPPWGIGGFAPILYEGSTILNPASVSPCTSAYPTGGYDC